MFSNIKLTVCVKAEDNIKTEYILPKLIKIKKGTFLMGSNDYWDNE